MSNLTIGVRVTLEDRRLLDMVCNARGEDLSDFVRRAIRKELASLSFLPEAQKKALGIKPPDPSGKGEGS
jgi:hypothetical protein